MLAIVGEPSLPGRQRECVLHAARPVGGEDAGDAAIAIKRERDLSLGVTRDGAGNITLITRTNLNLSRYKINGVDADVSYELPLDSFTDLDGRLVFRGLLSWVDSLTTYDGVGQIEFVKSQNTAFGIGVPKTRMTGTVTYDGDTFSGYIRGRYISAGNTDNLIRNVNGHIPAFGYLDLGVSAKLPYAKDTEIYVDISNLFDEAPPKGSNFSPYYDVVGRFFSVGARVGF